MTTALALPSLLPGELRENGLAGIPVDLSFEAWEAAYQIGGCGKIETRKRPGRAGNTPGQHQEVSLMHVQRTTLSERRAGYRAKARARNRAFIAEVNARTFCAHCGGQPVEWHNVEHAELNRDDRRIGNLVCQPASLKRIQDELAVCTPLCHRCHMIEDGRLQRFIENAPHVKTDPRPCARCQRATKDIRRGLCPKCHQHDRRRARGAPLQGPLTHCRKGHPLTDGNVFVEGSGRRRCRTCRLANQRDRWARNRSAS